MNRKILVIFLAFAIAMALWGGLPAQRVSAAISSVTINYYPRHIPIDASNPCNSGGGTPFAVHVTVAGDVGQNFTLQVQLQGGFPCIWSPTSSSWVLYGQAPQNYPRFTIGAGGTTDAWIYARVQSNSGGSNIRVDAYPCNASYSSCSFATQSSTASVSLFNMTTSGGWLEESDGTDRAGRAIAVKNSSSQVIGLYVAEPNGVNEGYSGDGYYKVAVQQCTNCMYTIETWELSNPGVSVGATNTMGLNNCPSDITAGATTSLNNCNSPTAITLVSFSATTPAGKAILLALLLLASLLLLSSVRHRAQVRSRIR